MDLPHVYENPELCGVDTIIDRQTLFLWQFDNSVDNQRFLTELNCSILFIRFQKCVSQQKKVEDQSVDIHLLLKFGIGPNKFPRLDEMIAPTKVDKEVDHQPLFSQDCTTW